MTLIVECHFGHDGLDLALPLRNTVLAQQESYMESNSSLLQDDYDTAGNSFHIIVRLGEDIVGAGRGTIDHGAGTAPDAHFDFHPFLTGADICGAGGYLCIDRRCRTQRGVYARLKSCIHAAFAAAGATHVKAVINPAAAPLFRRAGYRFLSERFIADSGLPCIAVLLDMAELGFGERRFIARHNRWPHDASHCRVFMGAGERLGAAGLRRFGALRILHGSALAVTANGTLNVGPHSDRLVTSAGRGDGIVASDVFATTDLEAVGFLHACEVEPSASRVADFLAA
jgi:hypothetical protein